MFRKSRSRYAKERDEHIETIKGLQLLGITTCAIRLHRDGFYERVCKEFYRSGLKRRREMRKKIFSKDS